ncbi:hypothetical protein [Sorangium sp. So ce1182]|uniref:hypothetical protein n=1 Tax=Sorangium sp. So ce1182 TaxID=3133334 RepID=UPI003F5ED9F6
MGPGLPLVVAGGVWTRAEAEALVDKGATAVALWRAAITNPDWPQRIAGAPAGRIRAGRAHRPSSVGFERGAGAPCRLRDGRAVAV